LTAGAEENRSTPTYREKTGLLLWERGGGALRPEIATEKRKKKKGSSGVTEKKHKFNQGREGKTEKKKKFDGKANGKRGQRKWKQSIDGKGPRPGPTIFN